MPYKKKPGYMLRAVIAWCIFNAILIATLVAVMFIMGGYRNIWFIQLPLIIAVIVSEWIIMAETIAPIIKEWIVQEERE